MTRNKLFLRSLLLTANRTTVSKFPTKINTDIKKKALHHAIPSACEGTFGDESVAFSKLVLVLDVLYILSFNWRTETFTICGFVDVDQKLQSLLNGKERGALSL